MFYCDACAKRCGWPESLIVKSRGPCEICGKVRICNDVPSRALPAAKKDWRPPKDEK